MASRISRKVCTLGRPGALGTGRWGSIQDHSASDKSVWYALLMLGTLPSHLLKAPFRTVSPRTLVNSVNRLVAYGPGDVFSRISRSTEVRGEEGGDLVLRWVPDLPGGGEDLARDSRGTGRRCGGQAGRGQHRRGGPSAPLYG